MSAWNGFGGLNLSGIEASDYVGIPEGNHVVRAMDAKIEDVAGSKTNKKLVVEFKEVGGPGRIRFQFNVHNTSEKAQEIGLRQLKSFLVSGGHPSPDNPRDISSLKGLVVGVTVAPGKPYLDKEGNEKIRNEIKRFFSPAELGEDAPAAPRQSAHAPRQPAKPADDNFDDDIPF
jgi:hypothetical protein